MYLIALHFHFTTFRMLNLTYFDYMSEVLVIILNIKILQVSVVTHLTRDGNVYVWFIENFLK